METKKNSQKRNSVQSKRSSTIGESVKVVVRVRPLLSKEKTAGHKRSTTIKNSRISLVASNGKNHEFTFDAVLDGVVTPKMVYDSFAKNVVDATLNKFNATIFSYGQTGSGKSFTMMDGAPGEKAGIIPLAFRHIFEHARRLQRGLSCADDEEFKNSEGTRFLLKASYLEIYNEEIHDLLRDHHLESKEKPILRECPKSGFFVENLSSHVVQSIDDLIGDPSKTKNEKRFSELVGFSDIGYIAPSASQVLDDAKLGPALKLGLIDRGNELRAVASTKMNKQSSRSHSIFSVEIRCAQEIEDAAAVKETVEDSRIVPKTVTWMSKLNLVDLAGSERQSQTGATGTRLKEAMKINQSLSTLGNVIRDLTDPKSLHIAYRDSVLTCLLQDSLGGNSKTVMIANVSPAAMNAEESLSTLRYAEQAKKIKNKPKVNQDDSSDALLLALQEKIAQSEAAMKARDEEITRRREEIQRKDLENEELRLSLKKADEWMSKQHAELQHERDVSEEERKRQFQLVRVKSMEKHSLLGEVTRLLDDRASSEKVMDGQRDLIDRLKVQIVSMEQDMEKMKSCYEEDIQSVHLEMEHMEKLNNSLIEKLSIEHAQAHDQHVTEAADLHVEMRALRSVKLAGDGEVMGPTPFNEALVLKGVQESNQKASELGLEFVEPNSLTVVVLNAQGLLAKDINLFSKNSSDPLVKMRFQHFSEEGQRIQNPRANPWIAISTTKRQTLTPKWNEQFTLPCTYDLRTKLEIRIEDWDLIGGNDFLGTVIIPLNELNSNGEFYRKVYTIGDKEGRVGAVNRGQIELGFRWTHDELWEELTKHLSPKHHISEHKWPHDLLHWARKNNFDGSKQEDQDQDSPASSPAEALSTKNSLFTFSWRSVFTSLKFFQLPATSRVPQFSSFFKSRSSMAAQDGGGV